MTNTEWLRARLTAGLGAVGTFSEAAARVSETEFFGQGGVLEEMVIHAKARKLMGAFRYEQVEDDGLPYDVKAKLGLTKTYMQRAAEKIKLYEKTGNQEYLVDLFNYALLEYSRPYHPNAHFASTERSDP